jgi:hypothetical protein
LRGTGVKNQVWRSSLVNSKVAAVFWPASSVARNAVAASRIALDVVVSRAPVGAIANATVRARATRTGRRWNRDARWLVVMRASRYPERQWTVHFGVALFHPGTAGFPAGHDVANSLRRRLEGVMGQA